MLARATVMSSARPGGRPPGQPGEYVGIERGIIGFSASEEGKIHDSVLSSKGRGCGNCKFCKIEDGNQGDITGIYRKKVFIKCEALRLLRTNSVRDNFDQSKRDLERGYPLTLVQENY